MTKPFMSKWRKDAINREHADRAARRRGSSGGAYTSPLTDPANPGAVYYQENHFYPDGSYTSETSSGYASRSDTDYGSRGSSSYSSNDSGSSSYDSGSSGGSYGE